MGYSVLRPEDQAWRESNLMKIPNTNLLEGLGGIERMGGRLWRMPPYSANTWHRHIDSWEYYFVLEGEGHMRIGDDTVEVSRYGSVHSGLCRDRFIVVTLENVLRIDSLTGRNWPIVAGQNGENQAILNDRYWE